MTPMDEALNQARLSAARGEVPVGAVVSNAAAQLIAAAGNRVEADADPSAHAELLALKQASLRLGQKFLPDCTLTVTLEPCAMCAGAIANFRVGRLVFGAYDAKSGAVEHGPRVFEQATTHHKPEIVGGVRDSDCGALLSAFFAGLRNASPEA